MKVRHAHTKINRRAHGKRDVDRGGPWIGNLFSQI